MTPTGERFPPRRRNQGDLAGSFVCYSRAWSSYFRGRLIRGGLTITRQAGGFAATYVQSRIQDRIEARGSVDVLRRGLLLYLREPHERTAFMLTLFPPRSLVSVFGGLIRGPAVLSADPQPSVSRIVMIRVPELPERLYDLDCLLGPTPRSPPTSRSWARRSPSPPRPTS